MAYHARRKAASSAAQRSVQILTLWLTPNATAPSTLARPRAPSLAAASLCRRGTAVRPPASCHCGPRSRSATCRPPAAGVRTRSRRSRPPSHHRRAVMGTWKPLNFHAVPWTHKLDPVLHAQLPDTGPPVAELTAALRILADELAAGASGTDTGRPGQLPRRCHLGKLAAGRASSRYRVVSCA